MISISTRSLLTLATLSLLLAVPSIARAQSDSSAVLTGILAVDIRNGLRESDDEASPFNEGSERPHKSVLLAGVLSAVVPGTGQIYAEAPWWRAVLYGTVEVAGWTLYGVYNAKGNAATNAFQNYADEHWDVTRYIDWVATNYTSWRSEDVNKAAVSEALASIYISNDPSLEPWERVDFAQLNKLERAVTGGFSHTLPAHGDQQYYEEIGKYFQYRAGWDDHQAAGDTVIFNPSAVSERNKDYVGQREHANALGSYAGTALGVVVVNHVVSLIDAVLQARGYNVSVRSEIRGMTLPNGERTLVTGIGVRMRF
jgi:hypothetical protein